MPYHSKKQYNRYMQSYMKRQRSAQAQTKRMMLRDLEGMERLRRNFPTAYELLFGKKRR